MMTEKNVCLKHIELTEAEAWALAQFLKRVHWGDFRKNAVDDADAYLMVCASTKITNALAGEGYDPGEVF